MPTTIVINIRLLVYLLSAITLLLILLSCVFSVLYDSDPLVQLLAKRIFLLDSEKSLPAFFAFFLLLVAAVLLSLITLQQKLAHNHHWMYWLFLSFLFVLLAYDEAAMLHESLIDPIRERYHLGGYLYFAWVIPGLLVVGLLAVVLLPFLFGLPAYFRYLFIFAGLMYIGGALGVEMVGGSYFEAYGRGPLYLMISTVEEALELIGVLIFIYGLGLFLTNGKHRIALEVTPAPSHEPAERTLLDQPALSGQRSEVC